MDHHRHRGHWALLADARVALPTRSLNQPGAVHTWPTIAHIGLWQAPDKLLSPDRSVFKLEARLHEGAVAVGAVLQELAEAVDRVRLEMPPTAADPQIECAGDPIAQHRFRLEAVAATAGRIGPKSEVVGVEGLLPGPRVGDFGGQLQSRREQDVA